jgi:hypothetical protein
MVHIQILRKSVGRPLGEVGREEELQIFANIM